MIDQIIAQEFKSGAEAKAYYFRHLVDTVLAETLTANLVPNNHIHSNSAHATSSHSQSSHMLELQLLRVYFQVMLMNKPFQAVAHLLKLK